MNAPISSSAKQVPAPASDLRIGGLTRLSTCDWPGKLVATIFLTGCPWRCRYCHNVHLLAADGPEAFGWRDVMDFLSRRRGLLDGVVFSGGEPTLQRALPAAMAAVRDIGFAVGLHTSGPYPDALDAVLPFANWVGFDVKAPFENYAGITGVPASGLAAKKSLERLVRGRCDYEVRTTVHPALIDSSSLERLARDLAAMGVRHYAVQAFRPDGCADTALVSSTAVDTPTLSPSACAAFDSFTLRVE